MSVPVFDLHTVLYQQYNRSCIFAVVPLLTVEISLYWRRGLCMSEAGDLQLKKTPRGVCAAWYRCGCLTQPYEAVVCAKWKVENE